MNWQAVLYALPMILAAATVFTLAVYTWRRRETLGAGAASVFLLAIGAWLLGTALELLTPGLAGKLFWAALAYLGIVTVPPNWLVFVLQYTGAQRWLTRPRIPLLYVVPLITWILFLTNGAHGLMWSEVDIDTISPLSSLAMKYGAWFWVHSAYSYLLMLLGAGLLVSMLFQASRIYRIQSAIFLVAMFIPLLANALYILHLSFTPSVDPTPVAFAVSGVIVVWGLFRFRLLNILPIARNAVVEGMRDGVVVLDPHDRVVDLNSAAQRILGYPLSKAVSRDAMEVVAGAGRLLKSPGGAEEVRTEMKLDAEGSRRDYELMLSPLRDRTGRVRGRLILLWDITERKRSEEELRRRATELGAANAELEDFAFLVSHELRAPLRSVNGFSRMLLEDYGSGLDVEARDYLDRIQDSGKRMGQLIDDLLALSRVTRREMHRETVDLSVMAQAVVEQHRATDPEHDVEVQVAGAVLAEGDPNLLRIALENLLGNAWKFSRDQARPRIEFGTEEQNGETVYYVRDNGVGFDQSDAQRLFNAFQRLHGDSQFDGTGIGLATVQRVIRRHGGRIWAESEPGEGATFYFTL